MTFDRAKLLACIAFFVFSLAGAVHGQTVPFEQITVDSSGPQDPWMKAVGDIDGDGRVDLIVVGRGGPVVAYHNPSWSKVTISSDIGSAGTTTDVTVGDVDGDGDLDIAVANGYWYENPLPTGNPLAGGWQRHTYDSFRGHDVLIVDLDGDGDADMVKRDQNSNGAEIRFLRQEDDGSWILRSLGNVPSGEGLNIVDLDSDGDMDVVIPQYWYENSGDIVSGAWTQRTYSTTYTYSRGAIAIGDFNNDGRNDIVVSPAEAAGTDYRTSWFATPQNPQSQPNFTEFVLEDDVEAVVHGIQVADFDTDGDDDVITAEMHQGDDPDNIVLHLNQSNGQSWVRETVSSGGSHNIQVADFDNDGDIDFFGANWNSSSAPDGADIVLWWNNHTGPAGLPLNDWERHVIDANKPWRALFITSGDIDSDGLQDIVTGGWWYRNPGDVSQSWARNNVGAGLNNMAAVEDFDRDGDLDVLGTQGEGSASNDTFVWAENGGSGQFTIRSNPANGSGDFLQGVAVDAFSSGGQMQVALSWHQAGQGIQTLTIPDNASSDEWVWQQISSTSQDEQISAGDIDRDGDKDLLLGTQWLRNDLGSWVTHSLHGTSGDPDRNRLADINGDGRLDAVVGFEAISIDGKLAWYEAPVDPTTLWTEHVIADIVGPMSVDVGDLDLDGDLDVVAGEHNLADPSTARLYVFENSNGAGTSWVQHIVHTGDEHHDGAQLVDIEGDGDLDIISIGWNNPRVLLYENKALNLTPVVRPAPPGNLTVQ